MVRNAFKEQCKPVSEEIMDKNIIASVYVDYEVPKSVSKVRKQQLLNCGCPKKPDVDNIQKAIFDALNGIAYKDDSQIVCATIFKAYGLENRIEIDFTYTDYEYGKVINLEEKKKESEVNG